MHKSAYNHAKDFFARYPIEGKILEVGSGYVNGSLRDHQPKNTDWIGVDCNSGIDVDVILKDPYSFPFEDGEFDCSLSSSVYEHVEFFWETFKEQCRCVKPGGYIYLNAPSRGFYHKFPLDCWRFYADSSIALCNWSNRCGYPVEIVESKIDNTSEWGDFVGIFQRV